MANAIVDRTSEEHADHREPEASRQTYQNLLRNCNRFKRILRTEDPTPMNYEVSSTNLSFYLKDI